MFFSKTGRSLMAVLIALGLGSAEPVMAQWCPIPPYFSDTNDVFKVSGKFYDSTGSEKKVSCTVPPSINAYGAFTGGSAVPPGRNFQGLFNTCGPELTPLSYPILIAGTESRLVKNGMARNQCTFVGMNPFGLLGGGGPHQGISITAVLKFDDMGNFISEKGVVNYGFEDGSMFIGKYLVKAR